ncbi:MAG: hypothetical protein KL787_09065 [Taibaiella sp.]|nr:hypothetical protein [Taibaiella sp.]
MPGKANAAFKEYKYSSITVNEDIYRIFNLFEQECNQVQDLYDTETTSPINTIKQKEWDRKIREWLKNE